jgi:formate--tetrahydrofolate ligase
MLSDIEIAQNTSLKKINEIANKLNIPEHQLILFGDYKAKINISLLKELENRPNGKLILVTAINPTPAGEGKTTTSIGLAQSLCALGKKAAVTIRQPSLGPVFGIKGGAAGGGFAQVLPMEDINLHLTGDNHAITAAHNMLAALMDNTIFQKRISMDLKRILWNRVLDVNDRSLRRVIVGLGGPKDGVVRETGCDITAASEIQAILCLSNNISELKEKIGKILLGFSPDDQPVYCKDLNVSGAIALLLKDAIHPNLVQTTEHTPAFIHGGPFANIAQGTNSILATKMAMKLNEITVTEAGFGADLGAEKFFDIVCPYGGFKPDLVVLVATARALKMHGGVPLEKVKEPNIDALKMGLANLGRHLENMKKFGMDVVVAINRRDTDDLEELNLIKAFVKNYGYEAEISEVFTKGSKGGLDLASTVIRKLEENNSKFKTLYEWNMPVKEKIRKIANEIYGADHVEFSVEATHELRKIECLKLDNLPICMAKTQYSFSDKPELLGAPSHYTLKVRNIIISSGAGFLVPLTGDILRMPGLSKEPSAEHMDIDDNGKITGLF